MDSQTVELAVQVIKALGGFKSCDKGRWEVGKNYFIRTVTHHYTGRLVEVTEHELWLEDAAWIADDGRFTQAVGGGKFNEVEPFPSGRCVAIGRGALLDATVFVNSLPTSQK